MNDQPRYSAAWPSLAIVLAGLYAFWTQGRSLDSARPRPDKTQEFPQPIPRDGLYAVHARLWEDPFERAYEATGVPTTYDPSIVRGDVSSGDEREMQATVESMINAGESKGRQSLQLRVEAHETISGSQSIVQSTLTPTIDEGRAKGRRSILMPVLVPVSDSVEDKEVRLRTRYAVLSALSETGFALSYPTRLTFLRVDDVSVDPTPGESRHDISFAIPVKLYTPDRFATRETDRQAIQVFVMWINESKLGTRPLSVIDQLVRRVTSDVDPAEYDVRIIGPSSSDVLVAMALEADPERIREATEKPVTIQMQIFSPRATVGRRIPKNQKPIESKGEPRYLIDRLANPDVGGQVQLIRVIGQDADLVELLRQELTIRGVWPGQHAAGELVLITESDSSYGRDVVNLFDDCLRTMTQPHKHRDHDHSNVGHTHEPGSTADHAAHFHVVKFVRGIDGDTPRRQSDRSPDRDNVQEYDPLSAPTSQSKLIGSQLLRPEGQSQFDYLVRLRDRLREIRDGKHHPESGGRMTIGAIGVVGTDIYDKLLILRALRTEFPQTLFFTTDLDAQFCHPAEYSTTRNLIVASHFGLQLTHSIQRETPPFRDSYQTGTFLAVRLALRDPRVISRLLAEGPWETTNRTVDPTLLLQPRLFEIGRRGPFPLVPAESASAARLLVRGPDSRQSNDSPATAVLARVAANWEVLIVVLIGALLVGGLVCRVNSVNRFFDSPRRLLPLSVWKSYFHWRIGISKSLWGQMLSMMRLSRAARTIVGIALLSVVTATLVLGIDALTLARDDWEPFSFFDAVSAWPTIFIRCAAIVIGVLYLRRLVAAIITWPSRRSNRRVSPYLLQCGDPAALFKPSASRRNELRDNPALRGWRQFEWAWRSCLYAAGLIVLFFLMQLVAPDNDFAHHSVRGIGPRQLSILVHRIAIGVSFVVVAAVVAEFENCRRCVSSIAQKLKRDGSLVPLRAIQHIGSMTRLLYHEIGWVIAVVVLTIIPYHPRMDYSPLSSFPVAFAALAIGSLVLWSYLIRRRANDAKTHAIRVLSEEKRSVNHVDRDFLPENDPWTKAVDLSRRRHSTVGTLDSGPEVSTVVATKVECDYIDDEINMIRAVDYGAYAPWYSAPGFAWLGGSAGAIALFDAMLRAAQNGF